MTDEDKITNCIARYVADNGAASLREIADAVYDETGIKVNRMRVWRILQRLGKFSKRWIKEAGE
jgi:hypothetical protein